MNAKLGQTYEQTNALDGFPYNRVCENWTVDNIKGNYIILKNNNVGLGVSEQELKEHFKLNTSYSDNEFDDVDEEYEEEEIEEQEEEIEEEVVEENPVQEDSDNKEVGKFNKFLRKLGFGKKN